MSRINRPAKKWTARRRHKARLRHQEDLKLLAILEKHGLASDSGNKWWFVSGSRIDKSQYNWCTGCKVVWPTVSFDWRISAVIGKEGHVFSLDDALQLAGIDVLQIAVARSIVRPG